MIASSLLVVLPGLIAAPILAALPGWRAAATANIGVCAIILLAAIRLAIAPGPIDDDAWLRPDALGIVLVLLTSFTGLTTAWFSRFYIRHEAEAERLGPRAIRLYHGAFPALLGFLLTALLSDNIGLTWVCLEAATIIGVLVVVLPGTEDAIEASWKFFILCGVAVALALFGTIMLYLAASPILGPGWPAMSWRGLAAAAPACNGGLLNLAFVFLLIGYGTKAGLVPLHGWMPDAHAEGPTPVSAILSGSVLNVALVVLLRLRGVIGANAAAGGAAIAPGPAMIILGLASVLVSAFCLWPRRDVKRWFAFSTIEQNGLVALAFGLGGPAANFAGLLHMIAHTLTKASIFQCVGRAAQLRGGQDFPHLSGLLRDQRLLAFTLAAGTIAVAGLPPFAMFSSEFLIASELARRMVWLSPLLGLGLIVGTWALLARLLDLCVGLPKGTGKSPSVGGAALASAWLNLAIVVGLGLAMPPALVNLLQQAAGP